MDTSRIEFEKKLLVDLSGRYGEVIGGKTLWRVLGYNTLAAFKQALNRGTLPLPTFFIEGRKGRYSLTSDVAAWLVKCRANVGKPSGIEVPDEFKRTKAK